MRINNNMSAVVTNNQLLNTEDSIANIMEKLSSGMSINHASDNPSGIAIAGKMQAQIDGLNQGSTNAKDGISVLQTAEGALGEVTEMIQRMRELSVQAANGTNSTSERESIQMEIDSLLEEIDRISSTTQFNSINLLDGSLDCRTYAEHCSRIQTSNSVAAGDYILTINTAATKATIGGNHISGGLKEYQTSDAAEGSVTKIDYETLDNTALSFIDYIDGISWESVKTVTKENGLKETEPKINGKGLPMDGTISVNGYNIEFKQGDTGDEVYEKLRRAAEYGNCSISDPEDSYDVVGTDADGNPVDITLYRPLSITSEKYGREACVNMTFSSNEFAAVLGFNNAGEKLVYGNDPDITLTRQSDLVDGKKVSEFGEQATVTYEGNKVTITDTKGFEISFLAEEGYQKTYQITTDDAGNEVEVEVPDSGKIVLNVTDIGSMVLQVGANKGQQMEVRIRNSSTESMYIDDVNVVKMNGPEEALVKFDGALSYITSLRAQLGAYENRLEHTANSLDETEENMTSAISRIEDADMATTMVEYTKYNVLAQAGTSALAQANELPQLALQLLQ